MSYQIVIPTAEVNGPKEGTQVQQLPASNLFAVNSPTIMEEWIITALYVPAQIQAQPEAEVNPGIISATLKLLYGGDIVWAETLEHNTGKVGAKTIIAGATSWFPLFGLSFQQPLHIRRGRSLTLVGSVHTSYNAEFLKMQISAERITASAELAEMQRNAGYLSYDAIALSGHRSL